MKRYLFGVITLQIVAAGAFASPIHLYGPRPYLQASDSPFAGLGLYLEDFEDGALNTPGVSASGVGIYFPPSGGSSTDSVDADDGAIDGDGRRGRSLWAAGLPGVTFTFDAAALGGLPTHVGVVWTDGIGDTIFEAYDGGGNFLASMSAYLGVPGQYGGQTDEDRFFGISDAGGIGSIMMSTGPNSGIEVDHLQYGRNVIPAPGAIFLGGIGVGVVGWLRRKLAL